MVRLISHLNHKSMNSFTFCSNVQLSKDDCMSSGLSWDRIRYITNAYSFHSHPDFPTTLSLLRYVEFWRRVDHSEMKLIDPPSPIPFPPHFISSSSLNILSVTSMSQFSESETSNNLQLFHLSSILIIFFTYFISIALLNEFRVSLRSHWSECTHEDLIERMMLWEWRRGGEGRLTLEWRVTLAWRAVSYSSRTSKRAENFSYSAYG